MNRLREWLVGHRQAEDERLAVLSPRGRLTAVVLLSGLGLLVELLLIRWLDTQVLALRFVKNLPLIASFVGLGAGYALAGRAWSALPLGVPALAAALTLGALLIDVPVAGPPSIESNILHSTASTPAELALFVTVITLVFALTVAATIPLGQIAGRAMRGLPPLRAYTANVLGGVLGVATMFLFAALWAPPWALATLVLAPQVALLRGRVHQAIATAIGLAAVAGMVRLDFGGEGPTVWSPYSKLEVRRYPPLVLPSGELLEVGWHIEAQTNYFQRMLDLRPETVARANNGGMTTAASAYDYPYTWRRPSRVLILGAGSGNDVAAALRAGVQHVDAVEIDPGIVELGRRLHPERPYDDPRVTVHVEDARAFLRRGGEPYEMIVFGLLDAHHIGYSSLSSSIRLDNYVYTLEALQAARGRLREDGVLSLAFYVDHPWLLPRLEAMVRLADGKPPLITSTSYDRGFLFLAGPGIDGPRGRPEVVVGIPPEMAATTPPTLSTDDWPFLYLRQRGVPSTVVWAGLAIFVVAVATVRGLFRGEARFDRHLFFMGAGFLLIETRAIAQFALLFGTTWQVSALTIGLILLLVLAANVVVARTGALPMAPLYGAMLLLLVASTHVTPASVPAGAVGAAVVVALNLGPLLFAALVFASSIGDREDLAPALASNLLGGVLGGLLENLALVLGFAQLGLVAVVVYALSFPRRSKAAPGTA